MTHTHTHTHLLRANRVYILAICKSYAYMSRKGGQITQIKRPIYCACLRSFWPPRRVSLSGRARMPLPNFPIRFVIIGFVVRCEPLPQPSLPGLYLGVSAWRPLCGAGAVCAHALSIPVAVACRRQPLSGANERINMCRCGARGVFRGRKTPHHRRSDIEPSDCRTEAPCARVHANPVWR